MGWQEPHKSHQGSAKVLHQNGKSPSAALELAAGEQLFQKVLELLLESMAAS